MAGQTGVEFLYREQQCTAVLALLVLLECICPGSCCGNAAAWMFEDVAATLQLLQCAMEAHPRFHVESHVGHVRKDLRLILPAFLHQHVWPDIWPGTRM